MRQSIDELLAIVHRYYPRGKSHVDSDREDTEEHRRLVKARQAAAAANGSCRMLLDRLKERFPEHVIQNCSVHLPTGGWDAGYVGWLWLASRGPLEKNHHLGFLVSFLVPCHVVYGSAHVARAQTQPEDDWPQEIRFTFSPDELPYARAITEEIAAIFPGSEPMPPEIGERIVPDVAVGTAPMGKVRLFECLFTEYW